MQRKPYMCAKLAELFRQLAVKKVNGYGVLSLRGDKPTGLGTGQCHAAGLAGPAYYLLSRKASHI